MTNQPKKTYLNQVQLKETAKLFLETAKAVGLIIIIGLAFPKIGGEIGRNAAGVGAIIVLLSYIIAMRLLREVKEK